MNAFEVTDGFDAIFCETMDDAQMVQREYTRRLSAIGLGGNVTICEVDIIGIPEAERQYVETLRKTLEAETARDDQP